MPTIHDLGQDYVSIKMRLDGSKLNYDILYIKDGKQQLLPAQFSDSPRTSIMARMITPKMSKSDVLKLIPGQKNPTAVNRLTEKDCDLSVISDKDIYRICLSLLVQGGQICMKPRMQQYFNW